MGACPGRSPGGWRAGWERSAVRRKVASSGLCPTVFMRADSILFYIKKELHQKCWSLLLISLLGKKLEGLNSVQLEWCGIPFNLMWHVFFFSLSVLTNGSCCLYVSGKAGHTITLRNPLLCSTKSEVLSDGKSWSCYGAQLVLTPTEEAELQILNSYSSKSM